MFPNQLSLPSVEKVASAIFEKGNPIVVEAYSSYDKEIRYFKKPSDVVDYAKEELTKKNGIVHLAVYFPEVGGELIISKINLIPEKCDGARFRFRSEGWGLIYVCLSVGVPASMASFVSANSEKRAIAWELTCPDLGVVSAWNWSAVLKYLRRLKNALRRAF
jgi:hypothetical protein